MLNRPGLASNFQSSESRDLCQVKKSQKFTQQFIGKIVPEQSLSCALTTETNYDAHVKPHDASQLELRQGQFQRIKCAAQPDVNKLHFYQCSSSHGSLYRSK